MVGGWIGIALFIYLAMFFRGDSNQLEDAEPSAEDKTHDLLVQLFLFWVIFLPIWIGLCIGGMK
jgi:hypothetical protein